MVRLYLVSHLYTDSDDTVPSIRFDGILTGRFNTLAPLCVTQTAVWSSANVASHWTANLLIVSSVVHPNAQLVGFPRCTNYTTNFMSPVAERRCRCSFFSIIFCLRFTATLFHTVIYEIEFTFTTMSWSTSSIYSSGSARLRRLGCFSLALFLNRHDFYAVQCTIRLLPTTIYFEFISEKCLFFLFEI